uniref:Homeobox domain-containing protein n=1 Tax=Leersia perrieri TaxID=77586 RepID=A0A0D9X6C5_9ORYZ
MDKELKVMASYVSKLKFLLQKDQQQEPHTANLLGSHGSSNQDEKNDLPQGENTVESCTRKKPKYQTPTTEQKERLNCAFRSCPYPDKIALEELAAALNMSSTQIKYWFQNNKTRIKKLKMNEEHEQLQKENENLKEENTELRNRMKNSTCRRCDLPLFQIDCDHLEDSVPMGQNKCKHGVTSNLIPQAASSLLPSSSGPVVPSSNLGSNAAFMAETVMPPSVLQPAPVIPDANLSIWHNLSVNGNDDYAERIILLDLAKRAMEEFTSLMEDKENEVKILWLPHMDILGVETLNYQEYLARSMATGQKPVDLKVNATRDTAIVNGSCVDLVQGLLDANRWRELFPGIVASANTTKIISTGPYNSYDKLLQLMRAELQVMLPKVPVFDVTFLRQSVHIKRGLWYVVDVSIDSVLPSGQTSRTAAARRMEVRLLPSGCIIQEMDNGYSKVTWMMHAAYDERVMPDVYHSLFRSGIAFGACRWVASLQRHSQFFSSLRNYIPCPGSTVTDLLRRRKILQLVKQMTSSFTAQCATMSKAMLRDDDFTYFENRIIGCAPGEPAGLVLSATTPVWFPEVNPRHLFEYLRSEQKPGQWRCLFGEQLHQSSVLPYGVPLNGSAYRMVDGLHEGHAISLISPRKMGDNISSTLLLQEARVDLSGSLIVYAGTDVNTIDSVMNGSLDPATVFLLPSGCAILPDCNDSFPLLPAASTAGQARRSKPGGSFVTVTYQMFVSSNGTAVSVRASLDKGRDALKKATNIFMDTVRLMADIAGDISM